MDSKKLAAEAQAIRYELGLNLREASKLTGLTKETISDVERARRRASAHTIKKLAEGYGVTTRQLLRPEAQELMSGKASAPTLSQAEREEERRDLEVVKRWVAARIRAYEFSDRKEAKSARVVLSWINEWALRDLDLDAASEHQLVDWAGELIEYLDTYLPPVRDSSKEEAPAVKH